MTAIARYVRSARGYVVDVTTREGTRTLPCIDETGKAAMQRADRINATGRDPYGYKVS